MPSMLFFDTETSGLDPKHHGILQIAWIIDKEDGTTIAEKKFDVQLTDECDVSPKALEINGFDLRSIYAGKHPSYVFEALYNDLIVAGGSTSYVVPCGWNVNFDIQFLMTAANRLKEKFFMYLDLKRMIDVLPVVRFLDRCGKLKREIMPDVFQSPSNFHLSTIAEWFNIPIVAHDALGDARATREIYYKVKKEYF